ncbi:MAG: DUF6276 family protein [Haloferacaceae archaeon]
MCPNPDCEGRTVAFRVPPDLRDYAPEGAAVAELCARCLRTFPTDGADAEPAPSFDAVLDAFPDGEAGAALALALGRLDRLALERPAVVACCEYAERAGADVYLTLDRLGTAGSVVPHFDADRRKQQLRTFL